MVVRSPSRGRLPLHSREQSPGLWSGNVRSLAFRPTNRSFVVLIFLILIFAFLSPGPHQEVLQSTTTSLSAFRDHLKEKYELQLFRSQHGGPSKEIDAHARPFQSISTTQSAAIDWSQYAYCQYATTVEYLCNSVMIFESLHRLNSSAERLLMYNSVWSLDNPNVDLTTPVSRLLLRARDDYGAVLQPVEILRGDGEYTWQESFTKLLAFKQTQYKRVLSLDSDATILQPMDELFLLPSAQVAAPLAYWLDEPVLSSQMILIEPSEHEFARVMEKIEGRTKQDFDMEIVNYLYLNSSMKIPHRGYDLLTGEFRKTNHTQYFFDKGDPRLQEEKERTAHWDAAAILEEAKFVHFSDWPMPKPWVVTLNADELVEKTQPACVMGENGGEEDCSDRDAWLGLYEDFRERRANVCDALG
ncbi:glucose N-acetyltransferase-like protein [Elsinoe australis]|uniref:Glucose N-acetyltransferase-like protein n=1 Tax=Elsinoe australis TaxID=40998 RepID=A0A4U7AYL3_9PEZI|nr:glucose N-acetyltransferase-like protein [Elsinoe australis]